jgi:hypothetical protein
LVPKGRTASESRRRLVGPSALKLSMPLSAPALSALTPALDQSYGSPAGADHAPERVVLWA